MSEQLDTSEKLSRSRVVMHWLLAASVLFLFVSSWWMLALPLPSEDFTYRVLPFQLHKNIGLSLFVVVVLLVAARLRAKPSAAREPKLLQRLAIIDHVIVYALLFTCCLSGYLSSSYSGWETSFWWLFDLPVWAQESDDLNIVFSDIHKWACWALLAVVALHISAALYHGMRDDGFINKMLRLD